MSMDRRKFLARTGAFTGALIFPWGSAASPVEPVREINEVFINSGARPPWKHGPLLTEWWYESKYPGIMQVEIWADTIEHGRVNIETHFIPANGGVYVQFPWGREPYKPNRLVARRHGTNDRFVANLDARPVHEIGTELLAISGEFIDGYYGMMWRKEEESDAARA